MTKCNLCTKEALDDSLLCRQCGMERLLAASVDRIMQGRGINLENSEKFTEDNYIAMLRRDDGDS